MKKYRVKIESDSDIENPADFDCNWTVHSFNRRHKAYTDPGDSQFHSIGFKRKLAVGLAFPLQYFEHGQCEWAISGRGSAGTDCPWDCVRHAGFIVWENKPDDIGGKTVEERMKDAKQFLEVYNDWSNGRGYYYSIERIEHCDSCEHDHDGESVDSCGGFYDSDIENMLSQIADSLRHDGWTGDDADIEWAGDCKDVMSYHSLPENKSAVA